MVAPINAIPGGGTPSPLNSPVPSSASRGWSIDEIVVTAFAFLGFIGAIFLPLRFGFDRVPPINVAFLLATGLAALAYRYLGGVQGASFAVGAFKLTGALGALVGIALLVNAKLVPEIPKPPPPPPLDQVWDVTGQVTDTAGNPIELLDANDIALEPQTLVNTGCGNFRLKIVSLPTQGGREAFPTLTISHDKYGQTPVDLTPGASPDVEVDPTQFTIKIKRILLTPKVPDKPYQPSGQTLQQIPYSQVIPGAH